MSKTLHRNLEAKLAALDGPEWESSDEEMVEQKVMKKIAKKKNGIDKPKSKKQSKREETEDSRVIYVGHIPAAFEETQLLQFLSQFGKVTNIKLSRSRRTGNSRGYAFVEFSDNEVAAIVADTMSGYFLMGERRLVCHIVPQDKIHPELFRGAKANLARSQAGFTSSDRLKILHDNQRKKVNATKSVDQMKKITKRLLNREKKKREQLKALGIDYEFPGYTASIRKEEDVSKASKKKRKVSVDESEDTDIVQTPKKVKSSKKTSKKSSGLKERNDSETLVDATDDSIMTPAKKIPPKKAKTEVKKKKKSKSASKKRRKSIE